MSQIDRLARPWREVETAAPAELASCSHSRWVKVNTKDDCISFQWATRKGFSLLLSCERCSYRRDSDDADGVKTVSTERVLGAKVVSKGIEDGHIRTAIALILSPKAGPNAGDDPPSTPAAQHHTEVVLYERSARAESLVRGFAARRQGTASSGQSQDAHHLFVVLPLSVQEYIAAQVNHFLEHLRGDFSVTIENDLLVNSEGVPVNPSQPGALHHTTASRVPHHTVPTSHQQQPTPPTATTDLPSDPASHAKPASIAVKPSAGGPAPAAAQTRSTLPTATTPNTAPAAGMLTQTFQGTGPICRPWRFTPSRPLALSTPPAIHEDSTSLTITISPPHFKQKASLIVRLAALLQVTIAALVFSEARRAYRLQARRIFIAARCADQVIRTEATHFPSQLATALLHAHSKPPANSADSSSAADVTLARSAIAGNLASGDHALTPFHRSPACGRHMVGSATMYFVVALLAWAVAIMAAYVVFVWMYELVGVHGAWYGVRLTPGSCAVLRTAPVLPGRWAAVRAWLRRLLGATPEEEVQEAVVKATVAVTHVEGSAVRTHLELHTATRVHRLLDPLTDPPHETLEATAAAINRFVHKHRAPHPALPPADCAAHTAGVTAATGDATHGAGADKALPVEFDVSLPHGGAHVSTAEDPPPGGNMHGISDRFDTERLLKHAAEAPASHPHASRPCMRIAAEPDTLASVFTPLRSGEKQLCTHGDHALVMEVPVDVEHAGPVADGEPGAGVTALGLPIEDLRQQQAAAVRAVNYQREDGRWVSTAIPPQASAAVQVLARSPGEVWLRVTRPSRRWTTVRTLALLPLSPLLATFAAVFGSSVLPPLVALRAAPACGTAAAVLALVPLFLRGAEVADVRVSRAGFRIVRVPWWLPVPRAIALSKWLPAYATARGQAADLAGAEVHLCAAPQGVGGCGLASSVRLHACSAARAPPGSREAAQTGSQPPGQTSRTAAGVSMLPLDDLWEPEAAPEFSVADKLFVAGHVNACLGELRWRELPPLPAAAPGGAAAAGGDPEKEGLLQSCEV